MRQLNLKRIMALTLVIVMAVSGTIEPKAATRRTVKLFGIHEYGNPEHSVFCSWMAKGEERIKNADPNASVVKRHYSTADTFHNLITKANY